MRNKTITFSILFIITSILLSSCNSCSGESENDSNLIENSNKNNVGKIVKFNGRLFSIPSPLQISNIIKSSNNYNKGILNSTYNKANYSSTYSQALNLGIYGADLAYIIISEKYDDGIKYFSTVRELTENLNINTSFQENILNDIEKNVTSKDSIYRIITKTYQDADKFLIDNERNDIATLIIAGGWVETIYIMTTLAKKNKSPELINRIGEQKYPLDNLIELLKPYYNYKSKKFNKLVEDLADLATVFDGVDINYAYIKPDVIKDKKLTIINSVSETVINDSQLDDIIRKIEIMRNNIVKN